MQSNSIIFSIILDKRQTTKNKEQDYHKGNPSEKAVF